VPDPDTLVVVISQSGETADTLAALKHAKGARHDQRTLAICNVPESAIVRETALRFITRAGPEIGVASTKAFTTQLAALALLTLALAKINGRLSAEEAEEPNASPQLRHLPVAVAEGGRARARDRAAGPSASPARSTRSSSAAACHWPIAMEGALKLKEISYIHAEAYAAGELKHGPLALVDKDMPVIAVSPATTSLLEKLKSNLQEVKRTRRRALRLRRCGQRDSGESEGVHILHMPEHYGMLSPVLHVIPLQLLSRTTRRW
jgi:glucosamine--fructose-6-phosphate aminotransferase (isomerizing)